MIQIAYLPSNIDDLTLAMIRHKTWITVHGRQYASKLLNQYDLAEVIEGAAEPMTPEQRRRAYRTWLWNQMQDEHGVVWRELCDLADAHAANEEITVTVHADTVHADVIKNAIEWMAGNTKPVPLPERTFRNGDIMFAYTGTEYPEERWPVYDPEADGEGDGSHAYFDYGRVRWIVGNQNVMLGYLYDIDAVQTALVVGHGLVKLGRDTRRLRPFVGPLDPDWVAEISAMLQDLAPDSIPLRLDDSGATVPEDIRYAAWRPDALVPDETNITAFNHDQVVGRTLPEITWRSQKRPYFLQRAQGENVRPVLRHHVSAQRPARVLDAEQQAAGRFNVWRTATASDWQQLQAH